MLETIRWTGSAVRLLDQTRLPEVAYVEITDEKQMHDAIRRLVVRGAPAIGVSAAFGVYLGVRNHLDDAPEQFMSRLDEVCNYLATSRPTAVNLFWAIDRVRAVAREMHGGASGSSPACQLARDLADAILHECLAMWEEDARSCHAIGEHTLDVFSHLISSERKTPTGVPTSVGTFARNELSHVPTEVGTPAQDEQVINILTHCNAGSLATVRYGTALAGIYLGIERGRKFHVFADETRPLLQGSRITATELSQAGVPVTVICDNMAATVMSQGKVDAVIVGADRIAANGDTANKIGTLGVAILAKHFGIPFYVAAPISTIDVKAATGAGIPIEERAANEITHLGNRKLAPEGAHIYNPAFDVTPASLITAIITDRGIVRPVARDGIASLLV